MRFAELDGRRVAVWGYGREGRAALAALTARCPGLPLTLFCSEAEAGEAARWRAPATGVELVVRTDTPDAEALAGFDVVIKSPGISPYTDAVRQAVARGTRFTSGTALWFGERGDARVAAVTGTKGKSTTSALLAHLARSLGVRTALAGNIGLPLLELLDAQADLWVVELSSFQTGEAGPLELGVVTSLYEEHLDWHGSRERYVADKLRLADVAGTLLVNATQPALLERTAAHPHRVAFGDRAGWHVDGDAIRNGAERVAAVRELSLPGAHNALNACAALAALELLGLDARAAVAALATFRPLPHRLQPLGVRDGLRWVNDSISTTPQAVLAALQSLQPWPQAGVTAIVGGHDRGLDWSGFAAAMAVRPAPALLLQGANAPRIAAALEAAGMTAFERIEGLEAAVLRAREITSQGGCVLLSPGAPSFDQFRDYAARGCRFAELAGFDPARIAGIPDLGVR